MAQPTLDAYVDSILYGSNHWGKDELAYSFDNFFDFWTPAAKTAFRAALKSWSDVADISFTEVAFSSNADLIEYYLNDADMTAEVGPDTLGAHYVPRGSAHTAPLEGFYNWQSFTWPAPSGNILESFDDGGRALAVFIHELGHALGLAHPHDKDGKTVLMPGVSSPFDLGKNKHNQGVFTVMSYNDGWHKQDPWGKGLYETGYNSGPGAFDIAAVQFLYGADTSNNVGATTYKLGGDMGWSAIWDTGGTDKIRYSGNEDAVINLNAAPLDEGKNAGGFLSYLKGRDNFGGYTIAGDFTDALADQDGETGVIIENATGGNGDDTITGNGVRNVLKGNGGRDVLLGKAGNDKIDAGTGNDLVKAGSGDDTVIGGGGGDVLVGGDGGDTLRGGNGGDTLRGDDGADELEGGGGADTLAGGSGADLLKGGSGNDLLKGGAGNDILRGAGGADTFEFRDGFDQDTIEGFTPGQDTLVLDSDLWVGPMTLAEAKTHAADVVADVVFDFDGVNILTLVGVNIADLTPADVDII